MATLEMSLRMVGSTRLLMMSLSRPEEMAKRMGVGRSVVNLLMQTWWVVLLSLWWCCGCGGVVGVVVLWV